MEEAKDGTAGRTLVTLQRRVEYVETVQMNVAPGHELEKVLAVMNSDAEEDEKTVRDAYGNVIATYGTKPEVGEVRYSDWELTD
jgi:hypothetical protein